MSKRSYMLIAALAIAFAGMVFFIAWDNDIPMREMGGYALFGVLLITLPLVALIRPNLIGTGAWGTRWCRYIFGAFALAFLGCWAP
jgi:hypothetical protein